MPSLAGHGALHGGTASAHGLGGLGAPFASSARSGSLGALGHGAPQEGQPTYGHVSGALQSPGEFGAVARAQLAHVEASLLPEPLFPTVNAITAYVWLAGRGGPGMDGSPASQLDSALAAASRVMATIDQGVTVSPPRKGTRLDTFVVKFVTDVVARLSTAQPRTVREGQARLVAAAARAASIAQQLSPPSPSPDLSQSLAHSQAQQLHLLHFGRNAIASAVTKAFAMPAVFSIMLSPHDEIALAQILVEGFATGAPSLTQPSLESVAMAIADAVTGPLTEAVVLRLRPFIVGLTALFLQGSPRRGVVPCRWVAFLRGASRGPCVGRDGFPSSFLCRAATAVSLGGLAGLGGPTPAAPASLAGWPRYRHRQHSRRPRTLR